MSDLLHWYWGLPGFVHFFLGVWIGYRVRVRIEEAKRSVA